MEHLQNTFLPSKSGAYRKKSEKNSIKKYVLIVAWIIFSLFFGALIIKTTSPDTLSLNSTKQITEGMPELARQAASEGAVLLKNQGLLPLPEGSRVSLFSRVQCDYFYVGYGSGGDVNSPYHISLLEGIKGCDKLKLYDELSDTYVKWSKKHPIPHSKHGTWPFHHPEMHITKSLAEKARSNSDVAIITIGRSSGEDRDLQLEKGSFYLTKEEINTLDVVTEIFDKVIVLLNVGSIIDMSWVSKYGDKISAILLVWQGGMESGNAVADLLSGKTNPSGRLCDTIAYNYKDYSSSNNFGSKYYVNYNEDIYVGYRYFETFAKDKVLYPFGYGLSYTEFKIEHLKTEQTEQEFEIHVNVLNIGKFAGKEVVQVYLEKPHGKLGNPIRELVGFAKTSLLKPNQSEKLIIKVDLYQLTSYDDCGVTNHKFAYVIEEGDYKFYVGKNCRENSEVYSHHEDETKVYQQLEQAAAPVTDLDIIYSAVEEGKIVKKERKAYKRQYDLKQRILNRLPKETAQTGDKGYKLSDVKNGKISMNEFVAQLDMKELEAITRGDYNMNSRLGAEGNAAVYGGVLQSLRDKGIEPVTTTDGPSGIRLKAFCSLLPIGTLLSCTFNTKLVEDLYSAISKEMKEKKSNVLLAPGMNIHRNPLCGRNFEYFSEDPFLSGKIGAAFVRGVQSNGVSACPKHFACNNQEFERFYLDSRLSERDLRQIYLKGFEICVKEARPINIMTSYNKINGVWGHYQYDLCTTILRKEWGYKGNVMTDWYIRKSKSPEFPNLRDQAYRIRAQVDLLMPGGNKNSGRKPDGTLLETYNKPEGITLGEIQRSAMNILLSIIKCK